MITFKTINSCNNSTNIKITPKANYFIYFNVSYKTEEGNISVQNMTPHSLLLTKTAATIFIITCEESLKTFLSKNGNGT